MILEGDCTFDRCSIESRRHSRESLLACQEEQSASSLPTEVTDWSHLGSGSDISYNNDPHIDGYYDAVDYDENDGPMRDDGFYRPSSRSSLNGKSVRFHTQLISSVILLETDEVDQEDIWYSSHDFSKNTRGIQQLVREARRLGIEETRFEDTFLSPDLRGLEDVACVEALLQRQQRMSRVIQGVLKEQRRQKLERIQDPLKLSMESSLISKDSQAIAIRRASRDAIAVEAIELRCTP